MTRVTQVSASRRKAIIDMLVAAEMAVAAQMVVAVQMMVAAPKRLVDAPTPL
jgi:hypothetical protein